jgi:four helix bundle protein
LRKHKNEFLLYLNRAYASAGETIEHLELLYETRSLADENLYQRLRGEYEQLCGKLFRFIQSVGESHEQPRYLKEDDTPYVA